MKPRVIIVGAGFGGLTAAQHLTDAGVDITLIDKRNHHLFQPLLYQVATADLSPAQIAFPIRAIFRNQSNVSVVLGEVAGVDLASSEVELDHHRIGFDYLVLATGARHSYFGNDEWERFAPGLKSLEDAVEIRRRILLAFERAENEEDSQEQSRLLTFVVVGGGPTGVELAGKIIEIARHSLLHEFRNIDPSAARVVLVEAGKRILQDFPTVLSDDAQRRLERLGVEISLGLPVTMCDGDGVIAGENRIEARTVVWAAGVAASPAAHWVDMPADRAGRAVVGTDLRVPGHKNIFVIGDAASARNPDGTQVPGLASAAKQQGLYVAKLIREDLAGSSEMSGFRYKDVGKLATIGRNAAVIDFGWARFTGFPAWLLWSVAHIYFLIGFRNRVVVVMDWLWTYATFKRSDRLIIGRSSDPAHSEPA